VKSGTEVKIWIPNSRALVGTNVYLQGLIDYGGNNYSLTTNALQWTFGR
jgi:hypothetical protein